MKAILPISAILCLTIIVPSHAESTLQTSAYRNSIAQDELRKRAEDVRQQLTLLLEDVRQNQVNTPEAELASRTAQSLLSLGDEQLLPLVQSLKDASVAEDQGKVLGQLTVASKEQKNIQALLKSMADGLSLHKDEATIQQRLQQLVLRQITNLRQTRAIASTGKPAEIASLCQSEQAALAREVDNTFSTLQRIVENTTDAEKTQFAAVFDTMKTSGTPALAATAATETSAGRYPEAIAAQSHLLDALQASLARFNSSQSPQERARMLAAQIAETAASQTALAEATRGASPAARQGLEEPQLQVADRIASLQQQVQDLNAAAAGVTAQAREAMAKAAEALKNPKDRKNDEIAELQSASAKSLKQAAEELIHTADQLAASDEKPRNAAQAMASLAQLSQQITAAQTEQNVLAANPSADPEKQKQLAVKTEELQKEALAHDEKAARNLGDAVEKMRNTDQKGAAQSLAEANAKIQAQMQAVARVAAQEQQMRAVSNKIAEAKATAADAMKEMQAAQPGAAQMEAIKKSGEAEAILEQAGQLAAATGAPEDVKTAIQQARAALEKSQLEAAQKKTQSAMQSNLSAQKNLDTAMQSIQESTSAALANAMQKQPPSRQNFPANTAQQASGTVVDGKSGGGTNASAGNEGSTQGDVKAAQNSTGLKPKEREAVALLQKESAPAEYKNMAGQYLKNLGQGVSPAASLP